MLAAKLTGKSLRRDLNPENWTGQSRNFATLFIADQIWMRPGTWRMNTARARTKIVGRSCFQGLSATRAGALALARREIMTNKAMKALIRRFHNKIARGGGLGRVPEFIGSDYVDHNAKQAGRGPDVFRTQMEAVRHTFLDLRLEIHDILAEADKVVT
jgi:hypothetical protein